MAYKSCSSPLTLGLFQYRKMKYCAIFLIGCTMPFSGLCADQQPLCLLSAPLPWCVTIFLTLYACSPSAGHVSLSVTTRPSDVCVISLPSFFALYNVWLSWCMATVFWTPFSSTTIVFGWSPTTLYGPVVRCWNLSLLMLPRYRRLPNRPSQMFCPQRSIVNWRTSVRLLPSCHSFFCITWTPHAIECRLVFAVRRSFDIATNLGHRDLFWHMYCS